MVKHEGAELTGRFIRFSLWTLLVLAITAPGILALYLYLHGGANTFARTPDFHVFIILVAILFSGFVSYVAWQSYLRTGYLFQRWLFLGLMGFTVLYAPHGFLTNVAGENIWLFILYGPAARLAMAVCILMAVINYGAQRSPDLEFPGRWRLLLKASAVYILLCLLVGALAFSPVAGERYVRWTIEGLAILAFAAALARMLSQRIDTGMMRQFAVVIFLFIQSSAVFLFPVAWSHSWWYAHVLFAFGFGLLTFQIGRVYLRTGTFETVFNEEELVENLRQVVANYQHLLEEQSHFSHMVSHDLKAPLRSVTLLIGRLNRDFDEMQADLRKSNLARIQEIALQMQNRVDALLRLSELKHSKPVLERIDLSELVASVIDLFQENLDEIGAVVRCDPLPVVWGDRDLLLDVFQNLVQNAIKYRRERPMLVIMIYARQHGAFWRIAVQDNGMGFDQAHAEDAFRMLGRIHNGNVSGSGAGLAICRKIVELHGGRMEVDAVPDRGAIFYVDLPALPVSEQSKADKPAT